MTYELSPAQIELLQIAQAGALHAVQRLYESEIRISFRLAELLDLAESETRHWPQHRDFDKPFVSAREIASAVREDLLAMPEGAQGWAACVGGEAAAPIYTTEKASELLKAHWATFTNQPAFGDDGWIHNQTVKVRRAWLVPGNIVHSSHGIRFQISRLHRRGEVTQIWSAQNGHSERYDSKDLIEVEVSSLSPGQCYLAG